MSPTLFKFRDLKSFERILDILLRKRLHAAKFASLNDPMEGVFSHHDNHKVKEFIASLNNEKKRLRICSLSADSENSLLWSYYADSHQGVAIGVKLRQGLAGFSPSKVSYTNSNRFEPFTGSQPDVEATRILTRKLTAWRHEKEVRVITKSAFVPVEIHSVLLGCKTSKSMSALIRELAALTCPNAIVRQMKISDFDQPIVVS